MCHCHPVAQTASGFLIRIKPPVTFVVNLQQTARKCVIAIHLHKLHLVGQVFLWELMLPMTAVSIYNKLQRNMSLPYVHLHKLHSECTLTLGYVWIPIKATLQVVVLYVNCMW